MSKTLEPNPPLTQESLRAEATSMEKLRRELAGGTATPSRMAEFAKRHPSSKRLLVGTGGIDLSEFLSYPLAHWLELE